MKIKYPLPGSEYFHIIRHRCPAVLFEALAGFKQGVVLDIGCGSGVILRYMERLNLKVIGIDLSEKAIELCRKYSEDLALDHEFYLCDIRDYRGKTNHFSAIIAMSSLVALKREEMILQLDKIKKAIKPGGIIYLEVFTIRDPMYKEENRYIPDGENSFFFPKWNSFMYFFNPGELLHRFRDFDILDYKELYNVDNYPSKHTHHEARLCCKKPKNK